MPSDPVRRLEERSDKQNPFTRVRVPLWATMAIAAGVMLLFLFLLAGRSTVDVGPAVNGAENVDVAITICNHIVDERRINPRQAELDFEKALKDLGAKRSKATVSRLDCPLPNPPPR